MEVLRIELGAEHAGQRLDRLLSERFPQLGRGAVRRLIEAGQVWLDGRPGRAGQRAPAGAVLELRDWPESGAAVADPALPLTVLHEDAQLLVVDKPAGIPSHPLRAGELGTLAGALLARYPELAGVGHSPREPGLLHRLDTDTSGLLIVARDADTFAQLGALLRAGRIDKRYEALCQGAVEAPALHRAWLSARGRRVTVQLGSDLEATARDRRAEPITTEVLSAAPLGSQAAALSLVQVRVHLARRHQVRAHLAALGHPIAGDTVYGGPPLPGLQRHYLHACALGFTHPVTGTRIEIESPRPAELAAVLGA